MRKTIRRVAMIGLSVLMAGAPEALLAARRGAQLRMTMANNDVVEGELIGVREEILVLETEQGDMTVGIRDATSLLVKNASGLWTGLAAGLAAGVAADVSMYHGYKNDMAQNEAAQLFEPILRPGMYAVMILVPAALGGLGAGIGHAAHKGITYHIKGMSDDELRGLLEKLRKKAMVPDYQ